jgi:bacteriocin-like protein
MKSSKIEQDARQQSKDIEVRKIEEISKDDLKQIAGGCGDMGGVVIIRF